VPKITSIEGYKKDQEALEKAIEFDPVNVWCDNCDSGLFSWKVDANNDRNHLMVCATCQTYYPILDVDDILGLLKGDPEEEPESDG
jgi:Zn finger protein HypA/HybF involved in hydrogenase expression